MANRPARERQALQVTAARMRTIHSLLGTSLLVVGAATGCERSPSRDTPGGAIDTPTVAVTDSLAVPLQPGETSRLPQGAPDARGAFRLAGNEPFWSVRIEATGLTYTTPDYLAGIRFPSVAPTEQGTTLRWVAITPPPDAHTLDVTLEAQRCQDTMADKTWTHTARVVFDGTELTGCGERLAPDPR